MDYIYKKFKFNIPSLKGLYYVLTRDLKMQNGNDYPRGFKKVKNVVNNMETIPPDMVPTKLLEIMDRYRRSKKWIHPLKLAFDFHLDYEEIHPFLDGNGRTGRLIMNKILISHGYFPIIIYSDNSTAYFNSISKALSGKGIKTYYQFMLIQTMKTYNSFISLIEKY